MTDKEPTDARQDLDAAAYNIYKECPSATFGEWCDELLLQYPLEVVDALGVDEEKVEAELKRVYDRLNHEHKPHINNSKTRNGD